MSGTGKTTYLEKLIPYLKAQGIRLGMVKHDAHRIEMDKPGKDTYRFTQAGADAIIISSPQKVALIEQPPQELTLDQVISRLPPVDLILTEGYKSIPNPKIEIHRKALGRPLLTPPEQLLAVCTDEPLSLSVPQFDLDDVAPCGDFILQWLEKLN
jgi:molybdopterin-guanine dinucleotide biosynthesis protein B